MKKYLFMFVFISIVFVNPVEASQFIMTPVKSLQFKITPEAIKIVERSIQALAVEYAINAGRFIDWHDPKMADDINYWTFKKEYLMLNLKNALCENATPSEEKAIRTLVVYYVVIIREWLKTLYTLTPEESLSIPISPEEFKKTEWFKALSSPENFLFYVYTIFYNEMMRKEIGSWDYTSLKETLVESGIMVQHRNNHIIYLLNGVEFARMTKPISWLERVKNFFLNIVTTYPIDKEKLTIDLQNWIWRELYSKGDPKNVPIWGQGNAALQQDLNALRPNKGKDWSEVKVTTFCKKWGINHDSLLETLKDYKEKQERWKREAAGVREIIEELDRRKISNDTD